MSDIRAAYYHLDTGTFVNNERPMRHLMVLGPMHFATLSAARKMQLGRISKAMVVCIALNDKLPDRVTEIRVYDEEADA